MTSDVNAGNFSGNFRKFPMKISRKFPGGGPLPPPPIILPPRHSAAKIPRTTPWTKMFALTSKLDISTMLLMTW
jgi:hypothetical protein